MKMRFKIAVVSDVGMKRPNNEDNYFVPGIGVKPMKDLAGRGYTEFVTDRAFVSVCDGMGGHSSGEVASYMVAKEMETKYDSFVNKRINNKKSLLEEVDRFITVTNDKVYDKAENTPELTTMGTTLSGLYFIKNTAYYVNVGDSRSYSFAPGKLIQLSTDHADSESKNAITRYMGMSSEYGRMEADIAYVPSKIGTHKRYLLCSDGLTDMVTDDAISNILGNESDPMRAAELLVEEANKFGGRDNITAIVIDVCPANPVAKLLKNKVMCGVLAAAIVAGGVVAGSIMLKPEVKPGPDFAQVQSDITNAANYSEAKSVALEAVSQYEESVDGYWEYFDSVKDDDADVNAKKSELSKAIEAFESGVNKFKSAIEDIDLDSSLSDKGKQQALEKLSAESGLSELQKACEDGYGNLRSAVDGYKKRKKAEEDAARKAKENEEASKAKEPPKSPSSDTPKSVQPGGKQPVVEPPVVEPPVVEPPVVEPSAVEPPAVEPSGIVDIR